MKRQKTKGKSARRGNRPAPYTKFDKKPYHYPGATRLASGELKEKMNDKVSNKYK